MIVTSAGARRLLVSCCVAALVIPDIARATQSALDFNRAELRTLTEQYNASIRKADYERLDEGHRLSLKYSGDTLEKALESTSGVFIERKRKLFRDFRDKRDALLTKIAQEEKDIQSSPPVISVDIAKSAHSTLPDVQLNSVRANQSDKRIFVSAAEAFLKNSNTSTYQTMPVASNDVEKFQQQKKWIEDQDQKEHDRQAAALRSASPADVHVIETAVNRPKMQSQEVKAEKPDNQKFVSAAEAFLNAPSMSRDTVSSAALSTDQEFRQHKAWIEEQHRKEYERFSGALRQSQSTNGYSNESSTRSKSSADDIQDRKQAQQDQIVRDAMEASANPNASQDKILGFVATVVIGLGALSVIQQRALAERLAKMTPEEKAAYYQDLYERERMERLQDSSLNRRY